MRYIDAFQAILLDMSGTFMFGGDRFAATEDFGHTYHFLGGTRLDGETVREIVLGVYADLDEVYHDPARYRAFPSLRTQLQVHPAATGLPEDELDRLENVFAQHEVGTIPRAHAETLHTLAQTHVLGLVSNIWAPSARFYQAFAQAGIGGLFDVVVFSSDLGSVKPAPEPFEAALTVLGLPADAAVYVGDDLRCDVRGARAAGLKSVWINPGPATSAAEAERVIADLRELPSLL